MRKTVSGYCGAIAGLLVMALGGCASSTQNTQGKMLDASAPYCQELRRDKPELYMDVCETMDGWRARDPRGFARRGEKDDSEGFVGFMFGLAAEKTIEAVVREFD